MSEAFYRFTVDGNPRIVPAGLHRIGIYTTGGVSLAVSACQWNVEWSTTNIEVLGGSPDLQSAVADVVQQYRKMKAEYDSRHNKAS